MLRVAILLQMPLVGDCMQMAQMKLKIYWEKVGCIGGVESMKYRRDIVQRKHCAVL